MTEVTMTLLNSYLGEVPSDIVGKVSATTTGIEIEKETALTRDGIIKFGGVYYGEFPQYADPKWCWQSRPILQMQGDLLGICGELSSNFPWVKSGIEVRQTICIGNWDIAVGPLFDNLLLLDTDPLMAKRVYPPAAWQLASDKARKRLMLGKWIVVHLTITISLDLKGIYTHLYFSSRCNSPQFAVNLPEFYRFELEECEI